MPAPHRRPASLLVAALAALAVGCGDDGGGPRAGVPADDPYVVALVEQLETDEALPLERGQVECLAQRIVGVIGVDNLEAAGIEPAELAAEEADLTVLDLSEEQADQIGASINDCGISFGELMVIGLEQSGSEIDDETAACIEDNVDDEAFADLVARAVIAGDEAAAELQGEVLQLIGSLAEACPGLDLFGAGG